MLAGLGYMLLFFNSGKGNHCPAGSTPSMCTTCTQGYDVAKLVSEKVYRQERRELQRKRGLLLMNAFAH